jgi:hypothetical protein
MAPDRTAYRAAVAEIAAKARAKLPEAINGRLEAAVKLVLAGDVERLDDGTIRVGSSDPTRWYHLVDQTCPCTDFSAGKAPAQLCKHRLAYGIWRRVQELLPPDGESGPEVHPASTPLPEAPCSANARVMLGAIEIQLTVRGYDAQEVLTRLQAAITTHRLQPVPKPAPRSGTWKRQGAGR